MPKKPGDGTLARARKLAIKARKIELGIPLDETFRPSKKRGRFAHDEGRGTEENPFKNKESERKTKLARQTSLERAKQFQIDQAIENATADKFLEPVDFMKSLERQLSSRGYTKLDLIKSLVEVKLFKTLINPKRETASDLKSLITSAENWLSPSAAFEEAIKNTSTDSDIYDRAARQVVDRLDRVLKTDPKLHAKVNQLLESVNLAPDEDIIESESEPITTD